MRKHTKPKDTFAHAASQEVKDHELNVSSEKKQPDKAQKKYYVNFDFYFKRTCFR